MEDKEAKLIAPNTWIEASSAAWGGSQKSSTQDSAHRTPPSLPSPAGSLSRAMGEPSSVRLLQSLLFLSPWMGTHAVSKPRNSLVALGEETMVKSYFDLLGP